MWVLTMFDLPTTTKRHKREYVRFHNYLIDNGFIMLQFSVYARALASPERAKVVESEVSNHLPPDGEIRVLSLTDQQFSRMQIFRSKKHAKTETQPEQFTFF